MKLNGLEFIKILWVLKLLIFELLDKNNLNKIKNLNFFILIKKISKLNN